MRSDLLCGLEMAAFTERKPRNAVMSVERYILLYRHSKVGRRRDTEKEEQVLACARVEF